MPATQADHLEICIAACLHCAAVGHECANISLKEKHLGPCIQLNLECAAICTAAATLMSFKSTYSEKICRICMDICEKCAVACENQTGSHCSESAKACRRCVAACRNYHAQLN